MFSLQRQQCLLVTQAAAVAGELAVAADHAMTRDDDCDWVRAVGQPDRARRFRIPNAAGELAIGDRLAVRDTLQSPPDRELERCAPHLQGQVEAPPIASKVVRELAHRAAERLGVIPPAGFGLRLILTLRESDELESFFIA